MTDILQELPIDQWPILQEKLKDLWPINLSGYYDLYISLKYPKVRDAFQFKVYCPYGDMNNGFVATKIKRARGQDIILYSITEDTSKLEETILKSKIIDWSDWIYFIPVNSIILQSIEKIRNMIGFTKYDTLLAKMHVLEKSTEPFTDLRLPANTYPASVKQEHIDRVTDTWSYKNPATNIFFSTLASNGLSYGLYSNTHELLAWVFFNEYNGLCHLYCEEAYRRKGYAEYVLKWAANEQLKQGNDVYGYIVNGNEKSVPLFNKLGFKAINDTAFVYVKK